MYSNLMAEVDYIRNGWKNYGVLEAIMFIKDCGELYSSEIRRELKQFLRDGAAMFAPKENA